MKTRATLTAVLLLMILFSASLGEALVEIRPVFNGSPLTQRFDALGGNGSISLYDYPWPGTNNMWTSTSNNDWILITSGSAGNGPGVVNFTVLPNTTGCLRIGSIHIEGDLYARAELNTLKIVQEPSSEDECLMFYGDHMQELPPGVDWGQGLRMVGDKAAGLMWEVKSPFPQDVNYSGRIYTDEEASDLYIPLLNSVNYGGFSDWRLPTPEELSSSLWLHTSSAGSTCFLKPSGYLGFGVLGFSFIDTGLCSDYQRVDECKQCRIKCLMDQVNCQICEQLNMSCNFCPACDPAACCPAIVIAVRSFSVPLTLAELDSYFPMSFSKGKVIPQHDREPIHSIVQICRNDPNYTNPLYEINLDQCRSIHESFSLQDLPVLHVGESSFITPWLDANWDNLIRSFNGPSANKFNTVFKGHPEDNEKFEVISGVDEANTPFFSTDNGGSYFFTYSTNAKGPAGAAVTMGEWIDYLKNITLEYGRPIDILTIFAHGGPGYVEMSEAFSFRTGDPDTESGMQRLWNEHERDTSYPFRGILNYGCSTILLFSCDVGQDPQFVQNLANWSGATVYANSVLTGPYDKKCSWPWSCSVTRDWDLDIVRKPQEFTPCTDTLEAPLRAQDNIAYMFPGGIAVEIGRDVLTGDGNLIITNTLEHLNDLGVDTSGKNFLAAYDISLGGTLIKDKMSIKITLPIDKIQGVNAASIKVKYWDVKLQQWLEAGIWDVQVDLNGKSITFKTNHTSIFAAVVENNRLPIAEAGPDQIVTAGGDCLARVTLDGMGSSDPDGDTLGYAWTGSFGASSDAKPTVILPLGTNVVTLTVNDGKGRTATDTVNIAVQDKTLPIVSINIPQSSNTFQDGVTFASEASDNCGVDKVYFYLREQGGGSGIPIGHEDLAAGFNFATGKWVYPFNTTQLPDGYYVLLAKAADSNGNEGWSGLVPISIRNWAILKLLPAAENNKAGRTMPVKFSLRIAAAVDPSQPFVYNQELEIRIYDGASNSLLQASLWGAAATDYRIDTVGKLYITNFKTGGKPAQYRVEIWRKNKNFMVGSFTFQTVK